MGQVGVWAGSSPRTRGTHHPRAHPTRRNRFIPAHAGNTSANAPMITAASVHPRACGEHATSASSQAHCRGASFGSSPRMRGTQSRRRMRSRKPRFIPAHAGNTVAWNGAENSISVHPRACGEHGIRAGLCNGHGGSSPRMRGTRV